jgi:hemerythrin-like metal-binding protein
VGHDELDGHHKTILSIVNELYTGVEEGRRRGPVDRFLEQLEDYAKRHFAREEELMKAHRFPGVASHQAAHRKYVLDLQRLRLKNLEPQGLTRHELLRFLKEWWLGHICDVDRLYGPYLGTPASPEGVPAGG